MDWNGRGGERPRDINRDSVATPHLQQPTPSPRLYRDLRMRPRIRNLWLSLQSGLTIH